MWDENSVYIRIETGYAHTKDMNDELVESFNSGSFSKNSAILKMKFFNPKKLVVQRLPIQERENDIEINRMGNGYTVYTLTSVDIQEFNKFGGKVIEIDEDVIYREKFKISPFREVTDKSFALGQKYKDENNDVKQILLEIIMNSFYGEQIRKHIGEKFACKSEYWMMSEYDERVKEYWKLSHGNYIVKMTDDEGFEEEVKKIPCHFT